MLVTQDSVVPFKGKRYFLLEFAARQALFYKKYKRGFLV